MSELKSKYDGFIAVDDVIDDLRLSRTHMDLLINRGEANTAIIQGVHYMTVAERDRFVDMVNKEKAALSEMFKQNDRIREDAVKEIAALLEE